MNLNNPAFLQSAGNKPMITRFVLTEESGGQVQLSANGLAIVEYVQDGAKVRNTYSALSNTYVPIPAGVEATVYGAVTVINYDENSNIFSSLDVSKNTALTELYCNDCTGLTSLDISKNTALTHLICGGCTGLTSLDLSKTTALTNLDCGGCTGLTSLDLSKNTALTYLSFFRCPGLTSLDLSKTTALTYLFCDECTGLTSLDLSKTTALIELNCSGCTGLTSLDLSKTTALTKLDCIGCTGLISLDLSKTTALTFLDCSGCTGLMLLDIQNTAQLENGYVFSGISTNLTTLQVAGTSAWSYEQVENWLNGDAPSDGTILVDENTPQEVITAATAKNWTVEYVDAA